MYTILHLEKSDLIKQMVKGILDNYSVGYLPTYTTDEALFYIEHQKLDLIVTSLILENESIEGFIQKINNSINHDTPIFIVTSNDLDDKAKSIINLGVSDYILKENLFAEIAKHVELIMVQERHMKHIIRSTVAIIDDSGLDQAVTKGVLNKNLIENVDCYKSYHELVDSQKEYDIYIVDAVLKNEYGKNIVMQIRRRHLNAAIIVVSSLNNPKTIASFLDSGADDYIQKPIDEKLFNAKLKSVMKFYIAQKANESYS